MSQHDDTDFDQYLEGETKLSKLYKAASSGEPPAHLDAKILSRAQAAAKTGAARPQRPRWLVPLSVAATVVLGVNLALNLKDYQQDTLYSETGGMVREDRASAEAKEESPATERVAPATSLPPAIGVQAYEPKPPPADDSGMPATAGDGNRARDELPLLMPRSRETDRAGGPIAKDADSTAAIQRESDPAKGSREALANKLADERDNATSERANPTFAAPPPALSGTARQGTPLQRAENAAQTDEQELRARRLAARQARSASEEALANAPAAADSDTIGKTRSQPPVAQSRAAEAEAIASPPPPAPVAPGVIVQRKLPARPGSADEDSIFASIAPAESGDDAGPSGSRTLIVVLAPDGSVSPPEEIIGSGPLASSQTFSVGNNDDGPYTCDLEKLGITATHIDAARFEALDARPPLNARTWLAHIWKLADEQRYRDGCRHLTAYIEMYGPVSLPPDLPLTVPE